MTQSTGRMMLGREGLSEAQANQYATQVAVALVHGNWTEAIAVINEAHRVHETEATAEVRQSDPRQLPLSATKMPPRVVAALEKHGFLLVGHLLLVRVEWIAAQRQIGQLAIYEILKALAELGINRNDFAKD